MFSERDVIDEIEFGWRVTNHLRTEEAHGAESVLIDYYAHIAWIKDVI